MACCKARNYALGGQLCHPDNDGNMAVITCSSRRFNGDELNSRTTEKEFLSMVHCVHVITLFRTTFLQLTTDLPGMRFGVSCCG